MEILFVPESTLKMMKVQGLTIDKLITEARAENVDYLLEKLGKGNFDRTAKFDFVCKVLGKSNLWINGTVLKSFDTDKDFDRLLNRISYEEKNVCDVERRPYDKEEAIKKALGDDKTLEKDGYEISITNGFIMVKVSDTLVSYILTGDKTLLVELYAYILKKAEENNFLIKPIRDAFISIV